MQAIEKVRLYLVQVRYERRGDREKFEVNPKKKKRRKEKKRGVNHKRAMLKEHTKDAEKNKRTTRTGT